MFGGKDHASDDGRLRGSQRPISMPYDNSLGTMDINAARVRTSSLFSSLAKLWTDNWELLNGESST